MKLLKRIWHCLRLKCWNGYYWRTSSMCGYCRQQWINWQAQR